MTIRQQDFVLDAIREVRAIPVLRSSSAENAIETAVALATGGLSIVEITYSVPDAAAVIEELAAIPGMIVGAGSVTSEAQAEEAIRAGAQFLVSPVSPPWLFGIADDASLAAIPGAATPTEIWHAHVLGASAVKVFPAARLGGAAFIRDLLAPLPDLKLIATGGVTIDSAAELLSAGCLAVGLGSIHSDASLGVTIEARARLVAERLRAL